MKIINDEFAENAVVVHPDECAAPNDQIAPESTIASNIKYLAMGMLFGIIAVKSEIISWYRIQEMFRMQSFHMYGVIGTAVVTGALSVWLIRKFNLKTMQGEEVIIHEKGWAITGACPGPLFAQLGSGFLIVVVTLLSAIGGTWVYGLLQNKLPH